MDVREKLVELLRDVQYLGGLEEKIADHLIANDVTVQEWIPVTKRLPDLELIDAKNDGFDLCSCLVTVKNFRVKNGRYVKKAWYDGDGFMDENCFVITNEVTHWMPLPQPPKGE